MLYVILLLAWYPVPPPVLPCCMLSCSSPGTLCHLPFSRAVCYPAPRLVPCAASRSAVLYVILLLAWYPVPPPVLPCCMLSCSSPGTLCRLPFSRAVCYPAPRLVPCAASRSPVLYVILLLAWHPVSPPVLPCCMLSCSSPGTLCRLPFSRAVSYPAPRLVPCAASRSPVLYLILLLAWYPVPPPVLPCCMLSCSSLGTLCRLPFSRAVCYPAPRLVPCAASRSPVLYVILLLAWYPVPPPVLPCCMLSCSSPGTLCHLPFSRAVCYPAPRLVPCVASRSPVLYVILLLAWYPVPPPVLPCCMLSCSSPGTLCHLPFSRAVCYPAPRLVPCAASRSPVLYVILLLAWYPVPPPVLPCCMLSCSSPGTLCRLPFSRAVCYPAPRLVPCAASRSPVLYVILLLAWYPVPPPVLPCCMLSCSSPGTLCHLPFSRAVCYPAPRLVPCATSRSPVLYVILLLAWYPVPPPVLPCCMLSCSLPGTLCRLPFSRAVCYPAPRLAPCAASRSPVLYVILLLAWFRPLCFSPDSAAVYLSARRPWRLRGCL